MRARCFGAARVGEVVGPNCPLNGVIGLGRGILRSHGVLRGVLRSRGGYLEDSWVLDIAPMSVALSLRLEAVPTPDHPLYEPPSPGERHCYRLAWLSVRAGGLIVVPFSGRRPASDASGEGRLGQCRRVVYVCGVSRAREPFVLRGEPAKRRRAAAAGTPSRRHSTRSASALSAR